MSEETKFVGSDVIETIDHEYSPEQIEYILVNETTVEAVREARSKANEAITLDALIGEVKLQPKQDGPEPNVIDPTDPVNEGKEETPEEKSEDATGTE